MKEQVGKKYDYSKYLYWKSATFEKVFSLIEKACKTNITVSVTGETGTGKEMVARAIHYNSDKSKKPFVAVNVAAIPRELIEGELLGMKKVHLQVLLPAVLVNLKRRITVRFF